MKEFGVFWKDQPRQSGKSSYLLNLIGQSNNYDQIYVICAFNKDSYLKVTPRKNIFKNFEAFLTDVFLYDNKTVPNNCLVILDEIKLEPMIALRMVEFGNKKVNGILHVYMRETVE